MRSVEVHDRHERRAREGDRVERDRGFEPVGELERDDVAGADPTGEQTGGELPGPVGDVADRGLGRAGVGPDPDCEPGRRDERPGDDLAEGVVGPPPLGAVAGRELRRGRAEGPVGGHARQTTSPLRELTLVSGNLYQRSVTEQKLFFEEVAVGATAPEVAHTLTRTDLVMYAGASGDFNPMHTDEVSAKEAGLPSVFGHGMLTAGILATAVTGYVGVGNLRHYKVRFTKQTWPGETLTTRVVVQRKYDEGGEHRVDLECTVVNQDGEAKLAGVAVAALPAQA